MTSIWLIVILAVLAANTPFMNERCFAIIAVQRFSFSKPLWCRALELLILYFVVGGIGMLLERNAGNRFQQGWEFYAITLCLFLVLAFPGFVFRYLRKRHG
ncbi:DUF2818 family protein [Undibacterium oligocarboniphilum]|uniref:DUF2818 family protein n=1 Tax=Undibacterium oligocarboniphilum TaxID=666702 RepID=A0A850QLH8_9BURK|nr:DUF2818 family protein [Undibacterium oligocarboniphilum]MBC3869016.1 DUF2818 family protein [Undibacterium oligocarboniphilum]NVO76996.1 DUF2818 family protein [Undibacterium oligocarboniphilum]